MSDLRRTVALALLLSSAGRARADEAGDVFVHSEPAGLPVFLDGVATGLVSPVLLRGVAPGPHQVAVAEGCRGGRTQVDVAAARIARAELTVGMASGSVRLVVTPDVGVTVSTPTTAPTAATTLELPCGATSLHVRAEGWKDLDVPVEVPAWSSVDVAIVLERDLRGTLVVATTPLTATVAVDGVVVANGPTTVEGLAVGEHRVEISAEGHAPYREAVPITADTVLRLDVVLDAEGARRQLGRGERKKVTAARWVLDGVVTGAALTAGGVALWQYGVADAAYERYLTTPRNADAQAIWDDEVAPAQTGAIVAGSLGGALLATGAVLWGTTFTW